MVLVILGSKSDKRFGDLACKTLEELGIPYELRISSAHRNPTETAKIVDGVEKKGFKVIIAMAGYAAHLPGFIASRTTLPVIGVPLDTSPLKGIDSLLSIVQMPSGIPVATVGIGEAGAKNAAILAAQILSIEDEELKKKLKGMREAWQR